MDAEFADLILFCAALPSGEKLWWADQGTDQIGTCDKKDGGNWKVLRNSTSPMMHMKIYNETVQKGAPPSAAYTWCISAPPPSDLPHAVWLDGLSGPQHICLRLRKSSLICFVYLFPCCFSVSQAPICAAITTETVPSCVSPLPRPAEPACARQDTACAEASSPARVRLPLHFGVQGNNESHKSKSEKKKLLIVLVCCRCRLFPALLRARGDPWYSPGPVRQV